MNDLPLFQWAARPRWRFHLHGRYPVTIRDGFPQPRRKTIVRRFDACTIADDSERAARQFADEFGSPDPVTGKTPAGLQWLRLDRGEQITEKR